MNKAYLLAAVLISTFFVQCKKSPVVIKNSDVYLAGLVDGAAKIWKNGVPTTLSNNSVEGAQAVCVTGSDVYACGDEIDTSTGVILAKLWKNGVGTTLSDGTKNAFAYSMDVSGPNKYVTITEQNVTVNSLLWNNGIITPFGNGTTAIWVHSLVVSGSKIYAGGSEYDSIGYGQGGVATIWKNGIATPTDGIEHTEIWSVFVSGSDVYASGFEYNLTSHKEVAKLWKNGVSVPLGTEAGNASSVYVSGADVYVALYGGLDHPIAKLWHNGVVTTVGDEIGRSWARSVFVTGSDVYVAFVQESEDGMSTAIKLWKNGIVTTIANGTTAWVHSVYVK